VDGKLQGATFTKNIKDKPACGKIIIGEGLLSARFTQRDETARPFPQKLQTHFHSPRFSVEKPGDFWIGWKSQTQAIAQRWTERQKKPMCGFTETWFFGASRPFLPAA
jgi:hypothetical protein